MSIDVQSANGELCANGKPFRIKGVTWWGAESNRGVLAGLDKRSLDDLLAAVARWGFNAIKVPFLHQHVLFDEPLPTSSFDHGLNPFLLADGRPVSYLDLLNVVARRAAGHGLVVWLVAHSLEDLWYSRSISERTVLDSWNSIARHLCFQWNIIGVDLKNKPSGAR